MLLCRLAGFYMPGGDWSSFEARYSFFCFGYVVHILDIFSFFRYFLLGSAYSRVFSLAWLTFLFFSTTLLLLVVSFSLSFAGFAKGYHLG